MPLHVPCWSVHYPSSYGCEGKKCGGGQAEASGDARPHQAVVASEQAGAEDAGRPAGGVPDANDSQGVHVEAHVTEERSPRGIESPGRTDVVDVGHAGSVPAGGHGPDADDSTVTALLADQTDHSSAGAHSDDPR